MKFTLIICTYMRPEAVILLLESVEQQSLYPDDILIIDGSLNEETKKRIEGKSFKNLRYFLVEPHQRGLTKQRNYGVNLVQADTEIVCFLDDDTILEADYFKEIIAVFQDNQEVVGVGGVAVNENLWKPKLPNVVYDIKRFYEWEDHVYPEGSRNILRNRLGLASDQPPGRMPAFSHGRTCGFPLTGKVYEVDLLIGLSFSFRKEIFNHIQFSNYFEGYGLYEDADFSVRAQQFGKNKITTRARLNHYHDPSGRPNKFRYGKMVVRNGWYVWRVKYPNPGWINVLKWYVISILLTLIRFSNIFTTRNKKEALTEFLGRTVGLFSLMIDKPLKK